MLITMLQGEAQCLQCPRKDGEEEEDDEFYNVVIDEDEEMEDEEEEHDEEDEETKMDGDINFDEELDAKKELLGVDGEKDIKWDSQKK